MTKDELTCLLKTSVLEWNKWRQANPKVKPDLSGVHLMRWKLIEACLNEVDLTEAVLMGADLRRAKLRGANLSRARLGGARLIGADLGGAQLTNANFVETDLTRANLNNADLQFADLTGATVVGADLRNANLEGAAVFGIKFRRNTRQMKFQGIRVATCCGSQRFKSFAQDQDYITDSDLTQTGGIPLSDGV